MNKAIIILALIVVVVAYTEATSHHCNTMCHRNQLSPIRCVKDSPTQCRKMRQCAIDQENCRRRARNQPRITSSSMGYCRYLKGSEGSGRCAGKKRYPRNINCNRQPCRNNSPILRCYRSKDNNCRRLTACQLQRINCHRGWSNALTIVDDDRQCSNVLLEVRRCRQVPRRG